MISQALETTKEQLSIAVTCDENHRFMTEERLDYNFSEIHFGAFASVQLQHCRESMKKETKISKKKKKNNTHRVDIHPSKTSVKPSKSYVNAK